MKAIAFSNIDIAVVAWTFGGKLKNCLGFAVYRIDVRAGTETCLPAMATFQGQQGGDPTENTGAWQIATYLHFLRGACRCAGLFFW